MAATAPAGAIENGALGPAVKSPPAADGTSVATLRNEKAAFRREAAHAVLDHDHRAAPALEARGGGDQWGEEHRGQDVDDAAGTRAAEQRAFPSDHAQGLVDEDVAVVDLLDNTVTAGEIISLSEWSYDELYTNGISVEELLDWSASGALTDAKTLIGLMWLQNWQSGRWTLQWQPAS